MTLSRSPEKTAESETSLGRARVNLCAPGKSWSRFCGSDEPGTIKLRTLYKHGKGPAKVSTPSYRSGYDAVFGAKSKDLN